MERNKNIEVETPSYQKVVVIMGSPSDIEHCRPMFSVFNELEINFEARVASAHKTPEYLMNVVSEYTEVADLQCVFIAVAGRSNALGGFVDFQTVFPVISSPPYSDKYGGSDIYSSLRMPSGCAAVTAAEAEMAALHAAKILALNNPELANMYLNYQKKMAQRIIDADNDLQENRSGLLTK